MQHEEANSIRDEFLVIFSNEENPRGFPRVSTSENKIRISSRIFSIG